MKYYTVEAICTDDGQRKIFKGVKAHSAESAVKIVDTRCSRDKSWAYNVYQSKYRKKAWSAGRERHESREQNRSAWAILSKHAGRRHHTCIKNDEILQYWVVMQRFREDWGNERIVTTATSKLENRFAPILEMLQD